MRHYIVIAVLVFASAIWGFESFVQAQPMLNGGDHNQIDLFNESPLELHNLSAALHFFDQKQAVIRFAEVALNGVLRNPGNVSPGNVISLALFDDAKYTAVVQSVELNINSTLTVIAKVAGFDFAWMIMTTSEERSLVNINIPETGKFYQITSDPFSLQHYLVEIDMEQQDVLPNSPPLIPNLLSEEKLLEQKRIIDELGGRNSGPNDPANIDVMIVYTPAAQNWANSSGGGINNVVAQSVASGQLVMVNSQTIMTVTLVHSALINYTESGNSGNDLQNFTFTNDGVMDEVHAWRNTYGADLNALFTFIDDTGGVGWLLNNRYGSAAYGFSISRVQQAGWTYTTIHEMGHNMGCHHHKQQNVQPGPTYWSNWPQNNWSAGWRWTGTNNGKYCSVMTYAHGSYFPDGITHTQVPYFSNPAVSYQGTATGHAADGDNARTLKEVKHYVAAYRAPAAVSPTVATASVTGITATSAISGGNVTDQGSAPVTARGVVWSTSELPTVGSNLGITFNGSGTGSFTSNLTGLTAGTTYFVRAYATNSAGTSYGNQLTFKALSVHTVSLPLGWSGLSSYLIPANTNIETMFQSIVPNMEILTTETGVYWPDGNVNTIVNWDRLDGYQIKMKNTVQFSITGATTSNRTLALTTGWTLMPVLSGNFANVVLLFAGQNLILVKEVAGTKLYWPQMNINTIGLLLPGKSYWVLMGGNGVIVFP